MLLSLILSFYILYFNIKLFTIPSFLCHCANMWHVLETMEFRGHVLHYNHEIKIRMKSDFSSSFCFTSCSMLGVTHHCSEDPGVLVEIETQGVASKHVLGLLSDLYTGIQRKLFPFFKAARSTQYTSDFVFIMRPPF